MYQKIEQLYKKESPYNRIKKKLFVLYYIVMVVLLVFNFLKAYILMILTIIITAFFMKQICEKELEEKLFFELNKKSTNGKPLNDIIREKENKMFFNYLIENKCYDEHILKCIVDHYRNLVTPKPISDNLITIISTVISILATFIDQNGFNINNFTNTIPYLISFVFITIIIYFSIKGYGEIKTFFKCEDRMFERLENIFSELYFEYIKETKHKTHKQEVSQKKVKNIQSKRTTKNIKK